ncbi:hypothetical protein Hanom_Chr03g00266271 [Helianthus anomalus]
MCDHKKYMQVVLWPHSVLVVTTCTMIPSKPHNVVRSSQSITRDSKPMTSLGK